MQQVEASRGIGADFDPKHGYNPDWEARSKTVEIAAPADLVWDILVDLPRYGAWNPFCIAAASTLEIGAPIVMTMRNPWNDDTAQITEYVCVVDRPRRLSWKMDWSEAWPYAGRRDQYLETLGPERCSYRTTDAFLGDSGVHIMRFGNGWIEAGFNATADALRAYAEARHAARGAASG